MAALESEKAIERAQAGRALEKYEKQTNFLTNIGKYGGQGLGYLLTGSMGPAGMVFAPAIGTALGQALATGLSAQGAKKLEDKYGSGYLGRTFKDMQKDVVESGLSRAGLSGLQTALMAKFAPSSTPQGIGTKSLKKFLTDSGMATDEIKNRLAKEAGNIGAGTSILQGLYDLGFGSPKFEWQLEGEE